jgi:glycosyltransferase involved in cell wall biosynthesis
MKSVLFLSVMNGCAWGGSEEIWYQTALWMGKNNYNAAVCCFGWEEKKNRISILKENNVAVFLLPNKKSIFKKLMLFNIVKKIPFEKYDTIFVNQGGWEDITHAPFKKLYHRFSKYVITYHNYNSDATLSNAKQTILKNWIKNSSLNILLTGKVLNLLKDNFNIEIEKKIVYVNPITFLPPSHAPSYPSLIHGNYIFLMLAEFDISRKAQDVLINVLSNDKWKNRNWQLHLYGKGKDEALLQELINTNHLQQKITLKGFTNNVKEILEQAHLLLQCTHLDAMPISVVEAMAMARPCVVSNIGDMPVWIKNNETGFVCDKINIEYLDEALENCWGKRADWAAMGNKAFEIFTKKYPRPYEEKMVELLQNL